MAVGLIHPCGINTFQVHPRGAELQILLSGTLVTEMTPEKNGVLTLETTTRRVIQNTLKPFDMTPFYQGEVSTTSSTLNARMQSLYRRSPSEDFGTGQVVDEVFSMDEGAIIGTFGQTLSGDQVEQIKASLPASIVQGVQLCMNKCYGMKI